MKYVMLLVLVVLAGCGTTQTQQVLVKDTTFVVVDIPKQLYNCPEIRAADLPDPETLTIGQITDLIERYENINGICRANMGGIKSYMARAKAEYAKRNVR